MIMMMRGLSLIELLVAMTVTTILTVGLSQAFQQSYRVWSVTEARRPVYARSNTLFECLRTEWSGLYLVPPAEHAARRPSDSRRQYINPNSPIFSLWHDPTAMRTTILQYHTLTPAWGQHLMASCPCRVRYEVLREASDATLSIRRFEQLCAGGQPIGEERSETILHGLSQFELWVANPGIAGLDWKRHFESQAFLPAAIKLVIAWPLERQKDMVSFEMLFDIPSSSRFERPRPAEEAG